MFLIITTVSVFAFNGFAQESRLAIDEVAPKKYVYVDVIKTYERIALKGYKSIDMFEKIADSYYSNSNMVKAADWYCELFVLTSDLEPEYYYRYAQALTAIGQKDKASEILEKFIKKYQHIGNSKILLKNKHHEK
jgi:tetratricopeptide (TPR) repeat protein